MKKLHLTALSICIFSLGFLLSGCKRSNEAGSEGQGAAAKAKEGMKEAAQATGQYVSEQKDKFMKEAKESYASLESQTNQLIADLKSNTSEQWQQMKSDLNEKMQVVKTKLDELGQKSGQAWQDSKGELTEALNNLKEAYNKAKAEFQKTDNMP